MTMFETLKPINHLMVALNHLNQVDGFELEKRKISLAIKEIYAAKTERLRGKELIDRLNDAELKAAIAIRDERIELYFGPHVNPDIFNYLRRSRPSVLARKNEN